jgi:hypothetical protein
MTDIKQEMTETVMSEGNAMLKALINKVVDLAAEVRGAGELIRKLPDHKESIHGWDKQLEKLQERTGELDQCIKDMTKSFDQRVAEMRVQLGGVDSLRVALERHAELFEKPLEKTVHYRHFLGQPLYVLGGTWLLVCLLVYFWMRTGVRAGQFTANDSKWRYLKLTHDSAVLHAAQKIERDYLAAPEDFKKLVSDEEERRTEEFENLIEEQSRHQEVDRLHKEEKIK